MFERHASEIGFASSWSCLKFTISKRKIISLKMTLAGSRRALHCSGSSAPTPTRVNDVVCSRSELIKTLDLRLGGDLIEVRLFAHTGTCGSIKYTTSRIMWEFNPSKCHPAPRDAGWLKHSTNILWPALIVLMNSVGKYEEIRFLVSLYSLKQTDGIVIKCHRSILEGRKRKTNFLEFCVKCCPMIML